MKKVLLIVAAIAIVFSVNSCKKGTTYGGDYVGTYTSFKYVNNQEQQDGEPQTNKKVSVRQLGDTQIYLYGIVPLDRKSDGVFGASELAGSVATQLLSAAGVGSFTSEQVKRINMEATFSGNHLSYRMYYELEIAGFGIDINILKFEGDKQE